jgi:hypothetical protein
MTQRDNAIQIVGLISGERTAFDGQHPTNSCGDR